VACGIAYNGKDKDGKDKWDRTQCFNAVGELNFCFGVWRYWNISVSNWFKNNLYLHNPGLIYLVVTKMSVAVWHGFNGGLVIFFIMMGFCDLTGRVLYRFYKKREKEGWSKLNLWILYILMQVFMFFQFNYSAIPFACFTVKCTLAIWRGVWVVPVLTIFFGTLSAIYLYTHKNENPAAEESKSEQQITGEQRTSKNIRRRR